MFGQPDTTSNSSSVPAVDPSVMADPSSVPAPAPAVEHPLTPAYPQETVAPQTADSISAAIAGLGSDDTSTPAPAAQTPTVTAQAPVSSPAPTSGATDDELLAIKQDALGALSPLVGNLEQSPEEKFRTTMMMIQASDDRSLVKTAYEVAQAITDEKVRAQALLDVVNEINYFTSHQD